MTKIIIIGGGIGGLATAACLRARGIASEVYERAAELREVGAALGLWPNATRVLKRLGLLDELAKLAHVPAAGALRDWRGRVLVKMMNFETEVPSVFAHRADLHGVLLGALPAGSVHLGKTCRGVERDGARIRAAFADGSFSEWGDGLIGADGIKSVLREGTLHDGPPVYCGYVAWRGVAAFETAEMVGETWGRGKRFGFIPLGRGRVGWWATANCGERAAEALGACPHAEWKRRLLESFGGAHRPIPQVLEATPAEAILCNAIMDRVPANPPRAWGEGAMTLLGDAAHPTTPNLGQGACLAIEDAAVVAHALAEIPDVAAAFRAYERARFARTAKVVRESLKMGRMGQWENALACGLRDWLASIAPTRGFQKQILDLWTYDAWNEPLAAVTAGAPSSLAAH